MGILDLEKGLKGQSERSSGGGHTPLDVFVVVFVVYLSWMNIGR